MKKLSLQELNRLSLSDFKASTKHPIVLVLDDIRSALNVGAAFRTADAFALEKIILCGITAQPPHREILKTAIGATQSVSWQYHKSIHTALQDLKAEGYLIVAVEQTDSSISLENFKINNNKKIALVLGNEVKGVSDEALAMSDLSLEIPQYGTKHSLNVSVCTGIVAWDILKQMKFSTQ